MFPGSPARLRAATPFVALAPLLQPGSVVGVWLRGCVRPAAIRVRVAGGLGCLLASDDMGFLLRRCRQVVIRDGERLVRVPARVLVSCRVLEVVLAAPFLPPPAQLRALFPSTRMRPDRLLVPIGLGSAEEALGICAAERLPVAGTRIRYLAQR